MCLIAAIFNWRSEENRIGEGRYKEREREREREGWGGVGWGVGEGERETEREREHERAFLYVHDARMHVQPNVLFSILQHIFRHIIKPILATTPTPPPSPLFPLSLYPACQDARTTKHPVYSPYLKQSSVKCLEQILALSGLKLLPARFIFRSNSALHWSLPIPFFGTL